MKYKLLASLSNKTQIAIGFLLCDWSEQVEDITAGGIGTGGNHLVIQTAGSQRFLVEPPLTSVKEGRFKRVPLLGGVTRHEGSFILGSKLQHDFMQRHKCCAELC